MNKGRLTQADLSDRLKEVGESPDCVGVEVVEGDRGGPVVGRLCGGMDNGIGPDFAKEGKDTTAVANVEFVMVERGAECGREPSLIPSRISLWSEKNSSLVVIDSVDLPPERGEVSAHFGANEAG